MRKKTVLLGVVLIYACLACTEARELGSGRERWKQSRLFGAVQSGNLDAVKKAITEGTDPNVIGPGGISLLQQAINSKQLEILKFLLATGANPKSPDNAAVVAVASRGNRLDIVRCLVEAGAPINTPSTSCHWDNALVAGVINGNVEMVAYLLEHGADPAGHDDLGTTALHMAARKGNIQVVEMLLRHGADVNQRDDYGQTALMLACREGKKEAVEFLLAHKADTTLADGYGANAEAWAREKHHEDIVPLCSGKTPAK